MLKFLYIAVTCAMLVCLFVCFERPAYAYIDPGSSLFLFQAVSSAFLGVLYFMRRRIKTLFGKKEAESTADGESE